MDSLGAISRSNWSHSRPTMQVGDVRDYAYRVGYILTAHGTVGLYDQSAKGRSKPHTAMNMVVGGRYVSASWDRTFSDRYLKTLATRFAAECVEEVR